ncbi:MAG: type IV pilus twitching motility protein PilT [Planctomycetota bacterium]
MTKPVEITDVFEWAAKEKASDVLLSAGVPPVIYIDGNIYSYGKTPLAAEDTQRMLYAILHSDQVATFERQRELDFSFTYDERHRFRGNAYWQRGLVGAAFRLIANLVPDLQTLGLPPVAKSFADLAQGLVIVSGPTGHGKSTTLASMVEHINTTRNCHIVTVEDPIEFLHTNKKAIIDQREVGTDTNSFAEAVRHVLRQAPHIIMVGEMRDLETISAVLTAAETGHLVLATLHTNDAAQSIDRMIDVFPPHQQSQIRVQLSMALVGILSQRLLPRAEGKGRILACEVLRNIHAVSHLIREGKTAQITGLLDTQARHGMQSMDSSVKQLFLKRLITEETARKIMLHPGNLFG